MARQFDSPLGPGAGGAAARLFLPAAAAAAAAAAPPPPRRDSLRPPGENTRYSRPPPTDHARGSGFGHAAPSRPAPALAPAASVRIFARLWENGAGAGRGATATAMRAGTAHVVRGEGKGAAN